MNGFGVHLVCGASTTSVLLFSRQGGSSSAFINPDPPPCAVRVSTVADAEFTPALTIDGIGVPIVAAAPDPSNGSRFSSAAVALHNGSTVAVSFTFAGTLPPGPIPMAAGSVIHPLVGGAHGVPAGGVGAVALNVTATEPQTAGYISVYRCGTPMTTSSLNFAAGETRANAVIAPLSFGEICLYSSATTHVILDLFGYYPISPGGLQPLPSLRLLDTRATSGGPGPLVAGAVAALNVDRRPGVVAGGVGGVALNVTVTNPVAAGYVSAFPCGSASPTSNLNFRAGQTVANLAIVPVGSEGDVCFSSSVGTELLVDALGWFPSGGGFHPVAPTRLADTRQDGQGRRVGISVARPAGVPADAAGIVLNVTATDPAGGGFVTVRDCSLGTTVSNLNFVQGDTVPNAVVAPANTSLFCVTSSVATHLIVDQFGWLTDEAFVGLTPTRILDSRQGGLV